jgi:hypothetical protein
MRHDLNRDGRRRRPSLALWRAGAAAVSSLNITRTGADLPTITEVGDTPPIRRRIAHTPNHR